MDAFEQAAISISSDKNLFKEAIIKNGNNVKTLINVNISKNVEVYSGDVLELVTTASFLSRATQIGNTITLLGKEWVVQKTLKDNGHIKTVIVT